MTMPLKDPEERKAYDRNYKLGRKQEKLDAEKERKAKKAHAARMYRAKKKAEKEEAMRNNNN